MVLLFAGAVSAQLDITGVTLTLTPEMGTPVVATASESDGSLVVDGPVTLMESTPYALVVTAQSGTEDITNLIIDTADNYRVFFQPMGSVFSGDILTLDSDSRGLPLGLNNQWTTECTEAGNVSGTLRVVLADLADGKSVSSTIDDGTALFDLSWDVTVEDDADAPPCENEEEIITDVVLTWTPVNGGDPVVARAQDPDGEGPLNLAILDEIELSESTEYTMAVTLSNSIEGEDITEEIMEEDDEHLFFFSFTDEIFVSPAGNGNVDNREDPINYNDTDENNLPVGLSTSWETECGEESSTGSFRIVLKHQPGIKSAVSTVSDGGTDVDLIFTINVNEDADAPPCENEEEIITDVVLTWTPMDGGDTIVARAQDPDGEGPLNLEILDDIILVDSTEYVMTMTLTNSIEGEDITTEIMEEDDEHLFLFEFTEGVFSDPAGDGNVDTRSDSIRYNDFDENGLPVGLSTTWSTKPSMGSGTFRVVLKHQPDIKSATSGFEDGGTDVDLTWTLNTTTDVNDIREELISRLTLAPNPTSGALDWNVMGQELDGQVEVRILSIAGQLLQLHRVPTPRIDVSRLPAGSYIFNLRTDRTSVSKQFIKVN